MSKKPVILIVDDDIAIRKSVTLMLKDQYKVVEASDYNSAIDEFMKNNIDLAILDIDYDSDRDGIDVLDYIKKYDESLPVIMFSSMSDVSKVVESIKHGAIDYVTKSIVDMEQALRLRIKSALDREILQRSIESIKQSYREDSTIISINPVIQNILREIEEMGEMNLLIEGETGVGKMPIARFANSCLSAGGHRPFVRINCSGLIRERFQNELFGHVKGAYTGAESDRKGLVELARGGDLFLDEIGNMSLDCQAEFLVFLDTGEYRRLGDAAVRYSDCRIIAATNDSLKEKVQEGKFRKDLFSRIGQCRFVIPPLRYRKEDVQPIVEFYIEKFCGFKKKYSPAIVELFKKQDWRDGNVRELKNAVMYMCQKARRSEEIELEHVNPYCLDLSLDVRLDSSLKNPDVLKDEVRDKGFENYISSVEKRVLESMIDGERSVRGLARKINMSGVTLHRRLNKYNIKIPR